ncbi:hypothetical protein L227DRAFT_358781 [Lentinus tigrinus ALCF2SS1-6]|uniref:MFS general substrate transporter n=1 Tax=Lentinus tigrinus ALCF2SS1-6 TaxID=1328759 RepID=A0A5C2SJB7_9APHY|nr:hypothetical protein L227DRAFT_358781 [Lentinus tigrinus ALCF2SS1-6]
MAKYVATGPTLVQAVLINIASSGCTASFWVTLTFLLGDPPYNYSTLTVGLFGLVGIFGLLMSPFVGWSIDKFTPWYGILIANGALLATYVLQTAAIGLHVSVAVILCISVDIFRQTQNVSLASQVLALEPNARGRLNSVLIISVCARRTRLPRALADETDALDSSSSAPSWVRLWDRRCSRSRAGAPAVRSASLGWCSPWLYSWYVVRTSRDTPGSDGMADADPSGLCTTTLKLLMLAGTQWSSTTVRYLSMKK